MKKIIILHTALLLCMANSFGQYFKGTWERDVTNTVNLKIAFKMKPTAAITTQISYMEAAFRFPAATTPAFTIDNIISNSAVFPGLSFQRFTPDFNADGFNYYKFVFNTAIVSSAAYVPAVDYTLFTITTSLPATATPNFEMISNNVLAQYQFGAVNGAGVFIDPATGDQLYGAGYKKENNDHIVPLFASLLPVKFRSFNATKKDSDALLTWSVDNQDANTSHFEVERSLNGIDFDNIKTVPANNLPGSANYTATDAFIAVLQAPAIYYRIKQLDKDGRSVYSEIKNIKIADKYKSSLYPNPATAQTMVSFYLPGPQQVSISVMDISGKTVERFTMMGRQGLNQKNIALAKLAVGSYKIAIETAAQSETLQFVKSK